MHDLDDSELDATATVDGFSYRVTVVPTAEGFQAHVIWLNASTNRDKPDMVSPPFKSARAAMIEGHAMAQECILDRRPR